MKTCRYCKLFEHDFNKLYSTILTSGKLSFKSIHIKCKEKEEIEKQKPKIKKPRKGNNLGNKNTVLTNIIRLPDTKTCSKCLIQKDISNFYLSKNITADAYCKNCRIKITSDYKNNNILKVKKYHAEYYQKHKNEPE
ncbi:MAG: hypothetical protein V4547_17720 [Bacteroidota bacterium]